MTCNTKNENQRDTLDFTAHQSEKKPLSEAAEYKNIKRATFDR